MKLISGLGNPGRRYRYTRHNVGFLAVDRIAKDLSIRLRKSRTLGSLIGEGNYKDDRIILQEPLTFMNLSGRALKAVAEARGIDTDRIVVVCDDVNLSFGKIRVRKSGSSGGHNGLKSAIEHLQTDLFPRIRIGVGREGIAGSDLTDYVLGKFERDELERIDEILSMVCEAVRTYLSDGIETAMNQFN